MLDTMTATKVAGALCGTLLVFLLGGWVAETVYATGSGHAGEEEQAYVIDTGAEEGGGEPKEEVDFPALVAAADPAKGEKIFTKCKACHKIDGTNSTGPHLENVVGREIASISDFSYSDVLQSMNAEQWTPDHLNGFLESPKGYAPGTKMGFAGLKKVEDRAEVVAYLKSLEG